MIYLLTFGLGMLFAPVAVYGLMVALDERDKRKIDRMMRGRRPQPETYEDSYESDK